MAGVSKYFRLKPSPEFGSCLYGKQACPHARDLWVYGQQMLGIWLGCFTGDGTYIHDIETYVEQITMNVESTGNVL